MRRFATGFNNRWAPQRMLRPGVVKDAMAGAIGYEGLREE